MSGFSTLGTAVTGLAAAQRSMDAIGQNIVNSNTPGYSRQRVLLESRGPVTAASLNTGRQAVFGGVQVADVSRVKDAFIEASRAASGARQSALASQSDILTSAQLLLSEPGETGLQSTLDSFYSSWHDLANSPKDTAAGAVVIQRGAALADQLRALSNGIATQWNTAHTDLAQNVVEINQASAALAELNGSIWTGQSSDQPVNELLDTRDTLIRKMAALVGASSSMDSQGRVSVNINGITVVSGQNWTPVSLTGSNDLSLAVTDPPTLVAGNLPVSVDSGSSAGLLATMRSDLPTMSTKADAVAAGLIEAVNKVYATGYAADASTGNAFFSGSTAMDIAVVPTDGDQLATAAAANVIDGSVALKIGDLADDATVAAILGRPGPSAKWRELTTSMGVRIQSLTTAKTVQDSVVAAADDAVTSDSGVNLDEEMTNMMLYQRAYQASARCITVADQMLDTLITGTGMVGR